MRRAVVIVMLAFATACGGGDDGDRAAPDATQPVASERPLRTEKGVDGPLYERVESSEEVSEDVDDGEEIFITGDGFAPKLLYAKVNAEIWFINETDSPQEVIFTNLEWRSGEIQPGKHASYTPDQGVTIAYRLASDKEHTGTINVSPYYDPGETAGPDVTYEPARSAPTD